MSADLKAEALAAFSEYDTDNSGSIDKLELALVCGSLGVSLTGAELEAAFKTLDASGDGKISFDEFFNWWNDESNSFTKASGVALQSLRARALAAKGAKFMKSLFSAKLASSPEEAKEKLQVQVGDFKEAAMGLDINITSNDVVGKGTGKAVAFDFTLASRESLAILNNLAFIITEGLKLSVLQSVPFGSQIAASGFEVDSTNFPSVRITLTVPNDVPDFLGQFAGVFPMIAGSSASVQLGFSFKDLASGVSKLTIKDLLNVKASVSLAKLPIPDEVIADVCQTIAGAPLAIGVDQEIEGLADLAAGNKAAKIDATKCALAVLDFNKETAKREANIDLDQPILSIFTEKLAGAVGDFQLKTTKNIVKIASLVIGRDFVSFDRIAAFDAENAMGLEINLVNLVNAPEILGFVLELIDATMSAKVAEMVASKQY